MSLHSHLSPLCTVAISLHVMTPARLYSASHTLLRPCSRETAALEQDWDMLIAGRSSTRDGTA